MESECDMCGTTIYELTITEKEAEVIKNLMETLATCPFELNDDDYMDILNEIAAHTNDLDEIADNVISIIYEEE